MNIYVTFLKVNPNTNNIDFISIIFYIKDYALLYYSKGI